MFYVMHSFILILSLIWVEALCDNPDNPNKTDKDLNGKHNGRYHEYHYEIPDKRSNKKPTIRLTYDIEVGFNPRVEIPKLNSKELARSSTVLESLPPFPFGLYDKNFKENIKKPEKKPTRVIEDEENVVPGETWPKLPKHAREHLTAFSSSVPWETIPNDEDYSQQSNVRLHPKRDSDTQDYNPDNVEMEYNYPYDSHMPPYFSSMPRGFEDMQETFLSFMKNFPFPRFFESVRDLERYNPYKNNHHLHFHKHESKHRPYLEEKMKPKHYVEEENDAFF